MDGYLPGTGTLLNTVAIIIGALLGMRIGHRLPERTKSAVTDVLGLVTILMAALSAAEVTNAHLAHAVAPLAPVLVVLAALLVGSVVGSLLRIEQRLEGLAGTLHALLQRRRSRRTCDSGQPRHAPQSPAADADNSTQRTFIDGWLTATVLFCVGPLTILGSLSDGMGLGYDQLAVKAVLDGFAALAFGSTYGWGVLASAGSVAVVQGGLTLGGWLLGSTMPPAHIAALSATGGLILGALGLRLLRIRDIPVADMLPALLFAPLLVAAMGLVG